MARKKTMKAHVSRTGKLIGGYVPRSIRQGIERWIASGPERDISTFIREAARQKLKADGIQYRETFREEEVAA